MHSFTLLVLALVSTVFVSAAPPQINHRKTLESDDVVLLGANGTHTVMKNADYQAQLKASGMQFYTVPKIPNRTYSSVPNLRKRCSTETVFTMNDDQSFLGDDVVMSSVVKADTETALVSVTSGYSISNSLSVSVSVDETLVEDFLSTSFGISTTETWGTSYTAAYTYTVPAGKYGVVVSNAKTLRKSGHVDIGCIAEATESYDFTSDSYTSQAYGGLSWVEGVIQLCTGDTYPVPMCTGNGTLS